MEGVTLRSLARELQDWDQVVVLAGDIPIKAYPGGNGYGKPGIPGDGTGQYIWPDAKTELSIYSKKDRFEEAKTLFMKDIMRKNNIRHGIIE